MPLVTANGTDNPGEARIAIDAVLLYNHSIFGYLKAIVIAILRYDASRQSNATSR